MSKFNKSNTIFLGPDAIVNDEVGGVAADLLSGDESEITAKNPGSSIVLSPRYLLKK